MLTFTCPDTARVKQSKDNQEEGYLWVYTPRTKLTSILELFVIFCEHGNLADFFSCNFFYAFGRDNVKKIIKQAHPCPKFRNFPVRPPPSHFFSLASPHKSTQ